jgi:NDP-sugar pyrophosphorylase family protein
MRAVILAGGKGTRLQPFTTLIPKPLVPVGGRYAILEIVLMQLAKAGFKHVTLAVNHLEHLIKAYFGEGSRWNIRVDYSLEDRPMSTIGPLTLIDDLPETFLVMNGDILCDLDYARFFREHVESSAEVSVSAFRREVKVDFGVLQFGLHDGALEGFVEKPTYAFDVSMGIYCINRDVVARLPRGKPYGFDTLMLDGLRDGTRIRVRPFDGYWLDIGRPDDYAYADEHFDKLADQLGINLPR